MKKYEPWTIKTNSTFLEISDHQKSDARIKTSHFSMKSSTIVNFLIEALSKNQPSGNEETKKYELE